MSISKRLRGAVPLGLVGNSVAETPPRIALEDVVGLGDKIKNKAEELTGQAKEKAGEHTDDRELRAEGQADQSKAGMKQTGEDIKDVFKK